MHGSMMCYVGVRHEYMLMTRDTMSCALVTVPLTMTSAAPLFLDMTQCAMMCFHRAHPLLLRASDTMSISGCPMALMVPCSN